MKTRRFTRKFHALVITLAMVISQLVAVVPSMAADALLPIAQYVTKTGSVKCGADGNSANLDARNSAFKTEVIDFGGAKIGRAHV